MKVEVLYIANCPNHKRAVEQVRAALDAVGRPASVEEVEVRTNSDAETWQFLGSPTVRVDGLDVEPEARGVQHFGVGCRSYVENGIRSGLPSENLVQNALQKTSDNPTLAMRPASREKSSQSTVLVVGGLAAVLASTCCLGPLLLVALGFSGAWIGNLSRLEPYRPWFIGASLLALYFAGRQIFRPAAACEPGEVCALPTTRRAYKVLFGIVTTLVVVALAFPYVVRLFY